MNFEREVVTHNDDDDKQSRSKQYLTEKLDRAESLIENIRREALKMAEDLEYVYNSVDAVRNSKSLNYFSDGVYLSNYLITYFIIVGDL